MIKILNDMNKILKTLFILCAVISVIGVFQSCKKDKETASPRIRYVRVTDVASADSLIVSSYLGSTIAIVGENLGNAVEVWFNNRKSVLVPTYVTDKSLIVNIPTLIPSEITNKLKVVFKDGTFLEYDFSIKINSPQLSTMLNEYALEGEETTITGNYFYAPVKVTFTGGAEAEVTDVEDLYIKFKIPAGAQPGPITVTSKFGETVSNFYYKDNRNIIIDSDPHLGWWGAAYVVTTVTANDPPKISGNYLRINKMLAAGSWTELVGGPNTTPLGQINSKRIPDEAITTPEKYNLKFEINTVKPYNGSMIRLNFGLAAQVNGAYLWNPPYDSKGKWQTVTIPFDEIVASYKNATPSVTPVVSTNGYFTRVMIWHASSPLDCDISFDNFRIVPKIAVP